MRRLSRTAAHKIAAAIALVLGVLGVILSFPLLWAGASVVDQAGTTPPFFVLVLGALTAPVQIVGAVGTWRSQRWGIVLLLLTCAVTMVSAAPGLLFAPTTALRLLAIATIVIHGLVVVLCLWPDRTTAAL